MTLQTTEFLQTQTYTAQRFRLMAMHSGAVQSGVWEAGDFDVAPGSGMSVNVAAGFSALKVTTAGNQGLYHVQNDATVNLTVSSAHATLPRVDSVYLTFRDSTIGDPSDTPLLQVLTGTAVSGAQIASVTGANYRSGAPSAPTNSLLLADILVPAASSSISGTNINDRRPWARGIQQWKSLTSSFSTTSTTFVPVTNFSSTLEVTNGSPIVVQFTGAFPLQAELQITVDSSSVFTGTITGFGSLFSWTVMNNPASGRHVIQPLFRSTTGASMTLNSQAQMMIQQYPAPFTDNT